MLTSLVSAVVIVAVTAASAAPAPMPGERAATLERQVVEKKALIDKLEKRNAELERTIAADPGAAGANLAARQEIRQNARYVTGYKAEVSEIERALARARAADGDALSGAAGAKQPAAPKAPKPAPPPEVAPAVVAEGAPAAGSAAAPAPLTTEPGSLDTAQVHELMRSWALGRDGVPGAPRAKADRAPVALLVGALDWRLDWRALSAGAVLGGAVGWALPSGLAALLRRSRPQRAPVVGSLSRKTATVVGTAGSPSKQWNQLAAKATVPIRIAASADLVVAVVAVTAALASATGVGTGLGATGRWGVVAEVALAIGLGGAAFALWRSKSLAAAFGTLALVALATSVPIALWLTPFGGPDAIGWVILLVCGVVAQVPALAALWPLATPRSSREACAAVAAAGTAVGVVSGLAVAALRLVAA